jgi:hypothetical protein
MIRLFPVFLLKKMLFFRLYFSLQFFYLIEKGRLLHESNYEPDRFYWLDFLNGPMVDILLVLLIV